MSKLINHNGLSSPDVNRELVFSVPAIFQAGITYNQAGQSFFVSSTAGVVGGNGLTPANAFLTVAAALAVATSGSVIFVAPGTYTAPLVVTTDYVTIVGTQSGYGRPDFTPVSGIALTVNAQGFRAVRCRFASTTAEAVRQAGNGFSYEDCVFDGNGAGTTGVRLKGDDTVTARTASEGVISGCLFRGCAKGLVFDTAAPLNGVGSTDNVIASNRFYTNTQDIVTADTGPGVYSVQTTLITGNEFGDKNKTNYIDLTTSNGGAASDQNGAIQGNYFAADAITAGNEVRMVGTGFTFSGNFTTVGVKDGSGLD